MGRDRSRSRSRSRGRHSPRRGQHSREGSPHRGKRSDHSRERSARRRDGSQDRHKAREGSRERSPARQPPSRHDHSPPRRGGGYDDRRRDRSPRDRRDEDLKRERSPRRHGQDDRHRDRGDRWRDEPPIKREHSDGIKREPNHHGSYDDRDRHRGGSHHDRDARDMPPPPPRGPRDDDRDRGRGGGGGRGRGRRDDRDRDDRGGGGKEVWGKPEDVVPEKPVAVVVQPNMELSGKLAQETNKVNGVVLKHQPPPDAAKPDKRWRLYVFKGDTLAEQEPLYLHRFDHCLFGRDPSVADVLCAHPSVSKQHAVIQFRKTAKPDEFGLEQWSIKPYLMDLDTVNGTMLNGERIEGSRFYELLPKDVIKFGQSTRDYVLLHEELAGS